MWSVRIVDIDGDGDLDALGIGSIPKDPKRFFTILQNDGTGHFKDAQSLAPRLSMDYRTYALAVGDVDGDGDVDMILPNFYPKVPGPAYALLLLNDGTGRYRPAPVGAMPKVGTVGIMTASLADLDGDGDLDYIQSAVPAKQIYIYMNDGKGHFRDESKKRIEALEGPFTIGVGDMDGDKDLDLVFGYASYQKVKYRNPIFFNDGKGNFKYSGISIPHKSNVDRVQLFDVDRDGDLDVFLQAYLADQLYLNDGKGKLKNVTSRLPKPSNYLGSSGSWVGDLDGNGALDLLLLPNGAAWYPYQLNALLNDGSGNFKLVEGILPPYLKPAFHGEPALGDFDNDGDLDLLSQSSGVIWPVIPPAVRVNSNLRRQVRSTAPPTIGQSYALRFDSLREPMWILPYMGTKTARIPVPGIGLFGLDPRSSFAMGAYYLSASKRYQVTLRLPVPKDSSLRGMRFSSQALYFDPTRSSFSGFSNVLTEAVR